MRRGRGGQFIRHVRISTINTAMLSVMQSRAPSAQVECNRTSTDLVNGRSVPALRSTRKESLPTICSLRTHAPYWRIPYRSHRSKCLMHHVHNVQCHHCQICQESTCPVARMHMLLCAVLHSAAHHSSSVCLTSPVRVAMSTAATAAESGKTIKEVARPAPSSRRRPTILQRASILNHPQCAQCSMHMWGCMTYVTAAAVGLSNSRFRHQVQKEPQLHANSHEHDEAKQHEPNWQHASPPQWSGHIPTHTDHAWIPLLVR